MAAVTCYMTAAFMTAMLYFFLKNSLFIALKIALTEERVMLELIPTPKAFSPVSEFISSI